MDDLLKGAIIQSGNDSCIALAEGEADERRYLNGPKLPEDRGHSTQDDIDGMFGCA